MLTIAELSASIQTIKDCHLVLEAMRVTLEDNLNYLCKALEIEESTEDCSKSQFLSVKDRETVKSISYDIISRKDTGFIINLVQFIKAYDLKCTNPDFVVDDSKIHD